MGEEDPSNLTLKKLQKAMDDLTPQEFCDNYIGVFNKIAEENSMKSGDFMIIHKNLYDKLPDPKPSWLKATLLIGEGEGYIVQDTSLKINFSKGVL